MPSGVFLASRCSPPLVVTSQRTALGQVAFEPTELKDFSDWFPDTRLHRKWVTLLEISERKKKKAKDFMQMWSTPPTKQIFFFHIFILSAASLEYTFSTYRCLKIERRSWHHWALPSQQDAFPCNISSRLQVTLQLWDAFGSSSWPGFIYTVILTHLVILTSTSTSNLYSKWVAAMKTR